MKGRVSDYIADFYYKNGINTLFTITGGFAMNLNDSFGVYGKYNIYYQHHEQGCGYSATGYTKIHNKPCIVCTTAGCAATNAITPCLVAHQDSIPIIFISGQVNSKETIRSMNTDKMKLRHYSGADSDIIGMVTPITKYAKEVTSVDELFIALNESMKEMISGRPGPVWLSIPVDLQGAIVELPEVPIIYNSIVHNDNTDAILLELNELIKNSKRPCIIAGNGIHLGGCRKKFTTFLEKYNIPVGVTIPGSDLITYENPLYVGKLGLIGDRAGNFAMQNCDLLISLGCRMAQGIVGYRSDWFAREAKIVYIDNDPNELEKTNVNYAMKVNMDLNVFFDNYNFEPGCYNEWVNKCEHWKKKWLYEMPENFIDDSHGVNPYYALKEFYVKAPENKITLASSGSIITNAWHMVNIKKGDRFVISSQGDMGFELPAAIGAQIAEPTKMVVPILGEGSFQLNIQELQTIMQNKLPIKIFLFNNASYGAIRITQEKIFGNKFGTDVSSGLSFPDSEKVANAYGLHYMCIRKNEDVEGKIQEFLDYAGGPVILEVFCCIQGRSPRLAARKNEDGTFSNRPLEDLEPFLDRKEFEEEMIVKIV